MIKKRYKLTLLLLTLALVLSLLPRCEYNNEEDLYGDLECDTSDYAYGTYILPLLEATDCIACHTIANPGGGVVLEGYDNLKQSVDDGSFLGSIRHDPGYSPMPKGGPKLPECDIFRIELWINQGAPNN